LSLKLKTMNEIKNGDVYDFGQTVNGVSQFLWFNNTWYYFTERLTREYEYKQTDLTIMVKSDMFDDVKYLGNILDNFKTE